MLTFVRSMMEWLGGTISKEDVGEDGTKGRQGNKRKRADDDNDEDALGAFALRFQLVSGLVSMLSSGLNGIAGTWNSSQHHKLCFKRTRRRTPS